MPRPERGIWKVVARPSYLVAVALFVVPLADVALTIWPYRISMVQWRFGAMGVLSDDLTLPLIGVLLFLVVALLLQHHRRLYVASLGTVVCAIVLLVLSGTFLIDVVRMGQTVLPEARTPPR